MEIYTYIYMHSNILKNDNSLILIFQVSCQNYTQSEVKKD